MDTDLFTGHLIRLGSDDPEMMAEAFGRWSLDSEYRRLMTSDPARLQSKEKIKEWVEKELQKDRPDIITFTIHTLEDDRLIGHAGLDGILWNQGDAFLSIGLGERQYWDRGYGTDALRVLLRYAFTELNLHRLSLTVFEYNQRAIRSYEKAGFVLEGRARQRLNREGRRWDMIFMGILRSEWQQV